MIIRLAHTDKGEYQLQDVEIQTEEGTEIVQKTVCIREPLVHSDIKKIVPEWSGGRMIKRISDKSGDRIDIIEAGDRVLQEALYDDNGNVISEAVMAGEMRYDIHVPDDYELTELETRVFPKQPDKLYA
jgi:hypothetical protein